MRLLRILQIFFSAVTVHGSSAFLQRDEFYLRKIPTVRHVMSLTTMIGLIHFYKGNSYSFFQGSATGKNVLYLVEKIWDDHGHQNDGTDGMYRALYSRYIFSSRLALYRLSVSDWFESTFWHPLLILPGVILFSFSIKIAFSVLDRKLCRKNWSSKFSIRCATFLRPWCSSYSSVYYYFFFLGGGREASKEFLSLY